MDLGSFRFDDLGVDIQFSSSEMAITRGFAPADPSWQPAWSNRSTLWAQRRPRGGADALSASPIVTLIGPGGIGKTQLALAAARSAEIDLSGGAWLVELADTASSSDVARAVADALDVATRRVDPD